MEKISDLKLHGNIKDVVGPTFGAFIPVLENRRSHIEAIPRKTFQYGSSSRHQLDIYYPITEGNKDKKTPILFFFYGGGFVTGDRMLPGSNDLVYACVGAYFAHQGFLTIIPDYRLALSPECQYPAPVEDIRDAVAWIIDNPQNITTPNSPSPDLDSLFMMGHSAGATHLSTMLTSPELSASITFRSRIAGAILITGAYYFGTDMEHTFHEEIAAYWGGPVEAGENAPGSLLKRASDEVVVGLPDILFVEAEHDDSFITLVGRMYYEALDSDARCKTKVTKILAAEHNHISLTIALGTGQGEKWAEEVVGWIKAVAAKRV